MGELNLEEFAATRAGREALEDYLEPKMRETVTAEGLLEELRSLLSAVDAAVLTGDIAAYLVANMREATRQGIDGWRDDDLAFDKSWGFSLKDIRVPVQLWHGKDDLFVPFAHGEWLAARIPTVDARLSPEDGHLTLMQRRIPEVHEWLLERF
jgi:pimeloyl-ACP methyl ester carboxylesterase